MATLTPAHAAPSMFSPVLALALVAAGVWAAVAAAFARNFGLTTYAQRSQLKLTLLWPFLAAFSRNFRQQLSSALRGVPVKVTKDSDPESKS